MSTKHICIAGATGWAGSALAIAVHEDESLTLSSGISRSHAGRNLAEVLDLDDAKIPVFASAREALDACPCDVFVEYTKPDVALNNIMTALESGADVLVGTSGLSDQDYEKVHQAAVDLDRSVLAVGNFALTAVLLQKFAEMAARYIPGFEVIDYAGAGKADVPSGTARQLAASLSSIRDAEIVVPAEQLKGPVATRGARLGGVQVHSVRLPGHTLSVEAIFGMDDERLAIRHDAGSSAKPYVSGALLAINKVGTFKGLRRGLDSVMEF